MTIERRVERKVGSDYFYKVRLSLDFLLSNYNLYLQRLMPGSPEALTISSYVININLFTPEIRLDQCSIIMNSIH